MRLIQAPREKVTQHARPITASPQRRPDGLGATARQHAVQQKHQRRHQKCAEHVRVLEGAGRALEAREQFVGARQQTEIAGERCRRRDGGRQRPGMQDQVRVFRRAIA